MSEADFAATTRRVRATMLEKSERKKTGCVWTPYVNRGRVTELAIVSKLPYTCRVAEASMRPELT